jgi:hypothetical protein
MEAPNAAEKMNEPSERHRRWVRRAAERSRTGLFTLTLLADWAIRLAVMGERNQEVRTARRGILLERWRRYSGDLARKPSAGP